MNPGHLLLLLYTQHLNPVVMMPGITCHINWTVLKSPLFRYIYVKQLVIESMSGQVKNSMSFKAHYYLRSQCDKFLDKI